MVPGWIRYQHHQAMNLGFLTTRPCGLEHNMQKCPWSLDHRCMMLYLNYTSYLRSDSNRHCSVPKTDASCLLGYAGSTKYTCLPPHRHIHEACYRIPASLMNVNHVPGNFRTTPSFTQMSSLVTPPLHSQTTLNLAGSFGSNCPIPYPKQVPPRAREAAREISGMFFTPPPQQSARRSKHTVGRQF